jgi:hypothetical protein
MTQETIKKAIQDGTPFFMGRITDIELRTAFDLRHGNPIKQDQIDLENNAGIHLQNMISLNIYVQRFIQAYEHCTHIAEWEKDGAMYRAVGHGQEWISKRTPHTPKFNAQNLEPYYFQDSWMSALKGKRILIIHPFVNSFQKQMSLFRDLFPNRSWFEDCTFIFVKPPMTMAGNHEGKDWQEHLDRFLLQLQGIEFDIALVAAGGYGMLIADHIYTNLKRSAMYIGGALQLFFGVIGKRWFNNKAILSLVNDHWIRPSQEERPLNHIKVEKGCYW